MAIKLKASGFLAIVVGMLAFMASDSGPLTGAWFLLAVLGFFIFVIGRLCDSA